MDQEVKFVGIFLIAFISSVIHHLMMSHRWVGAVVRDLHPSQVHPGSKVIIYTLQPQYSLGKPFVFRYWSGVCAETPLKYWG